MADLLGPALSVGPTGLHPDQALTQRHEFLARDVALEGPQLAGQRLMLLGGQGLLLQRAQLTTDLTLQIVDPGQVHLGGGQTSFGPFLAPAVLEDAGCLLNDGTPFLGPGVEDGVDLALGDDHVLVTTHPGI